MLQSLFRRAEASVDNAIAGVLLRALVGIPFLVAAGFATAGLFIYLMDEFGAIAGSLIMAGLFIVLGLVIAAVVAARSQPGAEATTVATAASAENAGEGPLLDPTDKEVLTAVLGVVGPLALPLVLRTVVRNLPLVAAVAAAGFVLTRPVAPDRTTDFQAAE